MEMINNLTGFVHVKILDSTNPMEYASKYEILMEVLKSKGLKGIITPNHIDVNAIESEKDVLFDIEGIAITAGDIIMLANMKVKAYNDMLSKTSKEAENISSEYAEPLDLTDPKAVEEFLEQQRQDTEKLILKYFPDTSEYSTIVSFTDDYINSFIDTKSIQYNITTTNPDLMAYGANGGFDAIMAYINEQENKSVPEESE